MNKTLRWTLPILVLGLIGNSGIRAAEAGKVLAAYAFYTQNQDSGATVALARLVLDGTGQSCPTLPAVGTMQARSNPDPEHFPVTVCEGLYTSAKAVPVPGSTLSLPPLHAKPKRIEVFGDTGYESKQLDDKDGWPFPDLASQAIARAPELVLHMGDYNYSGTPGEIEVHGKPVQVYDAGDNTTQGMCHIPAGYHGQNSPGSASPDTWAAWKTNFFDAAQGLLSTAPFVFLRGNHELCSRAGTGWFYLLDANSPLLGKYARQLSCPAATNPTPTVMSAPFAVDLDSIKLLVLDSTNACDSGLLNLDEYVNQFELLKQLNRNSPLAKHTWLLSHRPLWGVDKRDAVGACGPSEDDYCEITQTLQAADGRTGLSGTVDLVVSGHMHRFQMVDFEAPTHAGQFIVGNGGVRLAGDVPPETREMAIDGQPATVMGAKRFGYMNFRLEGAEWEGELYGVDDVILFNCQSARYPMCAE